jgi:aspartyl-tRNA(Asn)/glutamyl-tRNA(Gln) amidotransferase subunit A
MDLLNCREIARDVAAGRVSAKESITSALGYIAKLNPTVNAFTDVLSERALASAERIDSRRARGESLGPLAGVPFAVKNLIDVAGRPTRAGSKINNDRAPAAGDATLVQRLEAADAVLVGALNMGEYAYDFTGENPHYGPSRNPHDTTRMSGGSSGGSAAAVAAGMVPLALGSDTNGSIRVPAAFCGVFGLKPTFGRLSRAGSFPFVGSLDHLGPFARTVNDLAVAYDAMQGADIEDPVAANRPIEKTEGALPLGVRGVRMALATGYFASGADPDGIQAAESVAQSLGVTRTIDIPEAARARAAAQIITAAEGGALHLERLRSRPADFDPIVRDRLLAGLAIPAAWVELAHRFRRWYRDQLVALFDTVDIVIAPTAPCRAPKIGQTTLAANGKAAPLRPIMGRFTQPISFAGLPVAAVPVRIDDGLPLGVQIIAGPWREDLALRVAVHLEQTGVARAPVARIT